MVSQTDQEMLDYGPASYVPGDRWESIINKSERQIEQEKFCNLQATN